MAPPEIKLFELHLRQQFSVDAGVPLDSFGFAHLQQNGVYCSITGLPRCWDYLMSAVVRSHYNKLEGWIYPLSRGIDTDRLRMICCPTAQSHQRLTQNIDILCELEGYIEFEQTQVSEPDGYELFIIEADKRWLHNSMNLSLFKLILRTAMKRKYASSAEFMKMLAEHPHFYGGSLEKVKKLITCIPKFLKVEGSWTGHHSKDADSEYSDLHNYHRAGPATLFGLSGDYRNCNYFAKIIYDEVFSK